MPNRLPFPSSEGELNTYFQNNVAYLIANATRLNIDTTSQNAITQLMNDWNTVFPMSINLDLRTMTITMNKNKVRDDLMKAMRKIYKDIPETTFTTEDRVTFNLPKKKGYRSAPPIPSSVPVGRININNRLQHHISFFNDGGSKAKPYLVRGCQIWYKIGSPPTDVTEMSYMITAARASHSHNFEGQHAGKMVYYWLRWENTAGQAGPWSNEIMATIAG